MFKTPKFWAESEGLGQVLLPLSLIYFFAKRLISLIPVEQKKFNSKIICVGNITAGGTGKTPVSINLYEKIKTKFHDKKIAFITTGYGGKVFGPLLVNINKNTPKEVGDEAYLLANYGDSIMCKNRLEACNFGENLGYEILILDDGLHDKRIKKDLSICVVDVDFGLGNGLVIPAGPLRDRPDYAIADATELVMVNGNDHQLFRHIENRVRKKLNLSIAQTTQVSNHDKNNIYIAFAGIGIPQKFFDSLKRSGFVVTETVSFPDHHQYNEDDYEHLKNLASTQKAKLITTEKDHIKLSDEMKNITECVKIKSEIVSGNLLGRVDI